MSTKSGYNHTTLIILICPCWIAGIHGKFLYAKPICNLARLMTIWCWLENDINESKFALLTTHLTEPYNPLLDRNSQFVKHWCNRYLVNLGNASPIKCMLFMILQLLLHHGNKNDSLVDHICALIYVF